MFFAIQVQGTILHDANGKMLQFCCPDCAKMYIEQHADMLLQENAKVEFVILRFERSID